MTPSATPTLPRRPADDDTIPRADPAQFTGPRMYWPDAWRTPLLDAVEEVRLATRLEAGVLAAEVLDAREWGADGAAAGTDGDASDAELRQLVLEGQEAWQRFHTSNVGLVLAVVREVAHTVDDDLVQQGWLALGEALRRYDLRLGYRFSTFALHWIRNAVLIEYRRRVSVLSVSTSRLRNLALVSAVRAEIVEQGGVDDVGQVAARLGRPVDWVRAHWTRVVRAAADVADLEEVLGASGQHATPDAGDTDELWWLDRLPAREREVLEVRYGLGGRRPLSCAEIARRWRCSASEVRAMHARALDHARELSARGDDDGGVWQCGEVGGRADNPAFALPPTMGWLGLAG